MAQQSENKKSAITACILITVFLVAVFAVALVPRTSLQATKTDDLETKALKETYRAMFGPKPVNASDYSALNTPVPMYLAAIIGLKHGGWNESTLQNMTVYVSLEYCRFTDNWSTSAHTSGFEYLHSVTEPANDYWPGGSEVSPGDWVTYRYLWVVTVMRTTGTGSIPPPGLYYVDAATAELVSPPGAY